MEQRPPPAPPGTGPGTPSASAPEPPARLSREEVDALMREHFPQVADGGKMILIDEVAPGLCWVSLPESAEHLRPGGTVSGPAMVLLADVAVYVAILATLGADALQAVTTSLNVNFLKRPHPGTLRAEARLLKVGRRLVVGEVAIYDEDRSTLLAHVTATYALPDSVAVT